ncbi:MAG: hypothetical protein K0S25_531 [Bacillus sp. (in: firmicutes)]|nr:hypothetical protein [Bacillus sp. (in: firmicutes)]
MSFITLQLGKKPNLPILEKIKRPIKAFLPFSWSRENGLHHLISNSRNT